MKSRTILCMSSGANVIFGFFHYLPVEISRLRESTTFLVNFKMQAEEFQMGDRMVIRRLSPEEHGILNRGLDDGNLGVGSGQEKLLRKCEYCIHWSASPRGDGLLLDELADRVLKVVTCFRLYKSGDVAFPLIQSTAGDFRGRIVSELGRTVARGRDYYLSENEAKELPGFWKLFRRYLGTNDLSDRPDIKLAISRFNLYYSRVISHEEKLLDLMIGLEALIGEQVEQRYRMRNRLAQLLSTKSSEKSHIVLLFNAAYDVRNSVVHGSRHYKPGKAIQVDGAPVRLRDINYELERTLARAIKTSILFARTQKLSEREGLIRLLDDSLIMETAQTELRNLSRRYRRYLRTEH